MTSSFWVNASEMYRLTDNLRVRAIKVRGKQELGMYFSGRMLALPVCGPRLKRQHCNKKIIVNKNERKKKTVKKPVRLGYTPKSRKCPFFPKKINQSI